MLKRLFFGITIFVFCTVVPTYAEGMSQDEIDAINLQRQIEAEAEIARVKAAAEAKAKNEIDAATKTAEAFAEDVERRKNALEDWLDDQRLLAGLDPIYDDEENAVTDELVTDDLKEKLDAEPIAYKVSDKESQIIENFNDKTFEMDDMSNDKITTKNVLNSVDELNCCGLTLEEYDLFCRIIEAEAPHEGLNGKIMVANVIINRVASADFPNTITSVIKAPGQFGPVSSGKINRVIVTEETKLAVKKALNGENYAGGALYFRAASRGNNFLNKKYIATSGGNNFFA